MVKSHKCAVPYLKCPITGHGNYQKHKCLRKHICHRCGHRFKSHKCLVDHFRKFHKNGINICFRCKKYFYRIKWLYYHEIKCKNQFTQDEQLLCDVCDKKYFCHEFPNHVLTHLGVTSYYCELCFEHYISKTQFEEHLLNHKQIDNSTQLSSVMHTCDLCPSMFNHLIDFSFHYVSHIKEMPYSCNICCITFMEEKDCIIHSHLHKAGKMKCDLCSVKFENKLECLLHVLTHNTSKFFRNFFYISREDALLQENFDKIIAFYRSAEIIMTKDDLKDFYDSFEYVSWSGNGFDSLPKSYSKMNVEESVISNNVENDNSNEISEKTGVLNIKKEETLCTEKVKERNIAELKIKTEPESCSKLKSSESVVSEKNLVEMAEISTDSMNPFCYKGSEFNCDIIPSKSNHNCSHIKDEIICENLESDASLENNGDIFNSFDEKRNSHLRQSEMSTSKTLCAKDPVSQILLKNAVVKLHRLPQEVYDHSLQKTPVVIKDDVNCKRKRMHFSKCISWNSGNKQNNSKDSIRSGAYQSNIDKTNKHNNTISVINRKNAYSKPTKSVFQNNVPVFPTSFSATNTSLHHKKRETAGNYSSLVHLTKSSSIEHALRTKCNNKCERNIYGRPMCNHKCFSTKNVALHHKKSETTANYSSLIRSPKLSSLEHALSTKCNGKCERNIYGKPMCNHIPDKVLLTNLFGLRTEKKLQPSNANNLVKCVVLSGKNSLALMQKNNVVETGSCINLSKSITADSRLISVKNISAHNAHNQIRTPVDKFILRKSNSPSLQKHSVTDNRSIQLRTFAARKFLPKIESSVTSLVNKQLDGVKLINNTPRSGLPIIETVGSVVSFDRDKTNEGKRSYQIYTPIMEKMTKSCSVQNVNLPIKSKAKKGEFPTLKQSKIQSSRSAMLPKQNASPTVLFTMITRPYESSLKLENVEKMRDIKGLLK